MGNLERRNNPTHHDEGAERVEHRLNEAIRGPWSTPSKNGSFELHVNQHEEVRCSVTAPHSRCSRDGKLEDRVSRYI